jgi:replicative DNA helicase
MTEIKFSLETEYEVLETLMHFADPNHLRVQKAMLKLNSECFYNLENREIYELIRDKFNTQQPFNFLDILTMIPRDDYNLHSALKEMVHNYCQLHHGEASFEHYVDRLIILKRLRKQIQLSERMIKEVNHCADPEESQEILVRSLNEISNLSYQESKSGISSEQLAESFYEGNLQQDLIIPTTCDQLNSALNGGIMSKSLITVAAAAGVGKTGFSLYLLDAIARNQPGTQSLFFSLEMESKHIWMRHVGICGGKQFDKLDKDQRLEAVSKSLSVPITIYDTATCISSCDIDFILTTARMRSLEKPISVIVVDYLGLVENRGKFERNDLKQADNTSKLAKLALELNCIVIALSQVNRGAAQRAKDDQCPWPQDAADSSGSHRSSTLWLGIDRPELYQDDLHYRNQFVVKCRKNRFGGTFELILAFNEGTFAEVSHGWFKKPSKIAKSPEEALFSPLGKDFNEVE